MNRKILSLIAALLLIIGTILSCQRESTAEDAMANQSLPKLVDYNFHIRPILSDRCFACHGFDEKSREADLRLDDEASAYRLLDNGRQVITPGKVKKSEVWHRIQTDDPDLMMPPPESNLALTKYEKKLITKWIKQGAVYKKHWAFTSPVNGDIPKASNKKWVNNEIDHFILNRLAGTGLKVAQQEKKEKLLRRLSFDLTGLPPTQEDLADFLADESPSAYAKQVDRLLASPHYGERMASIWLEAARYADSHGYQDDRPRTIWPWRDWVIKAYNQNLPYNDFLTWQLAGDLLPEATYEQKLATAFNRNHGITQEGGIVEEEYITEYVADRTNTVATAFLGLTMECARCHDHKYDPISQKDYYQLFAFFNGVKERGRISYFDEAPVPHMRMEDPALEEKIAWLDSLRQLKTNELQELAVAPNAEFEEWVEKSYPKEDLSAQLEEGLLAYFKIDQFENLASPNELEQGLEGRVNVKILSELKVPNIGPGKEGTAMQFDGKNYLSLGDVGDFEESDHFSFGAWVKPQKRPEKLAGLLVKRNGEQRQGGYHLSMTPKGELLGALIHDKNEQRIEVRTKKRLAVGAWSHILMAYDGSGRASGITLYINGVPQEIVVEADRLNRRSILNGNDFLVGNWTPRRARSGRYEGFEEGWIDEVRIYDRTLSDPEVSAIVGQAELFNYAAIKGNRDKYQSVQEYYLNRYDPTFQSLKKELDSLRGIYLSIPRVMIMEEMDKPRPTFVLNRGAYDSPLEKVDPGTPDAILPFPADYPRNRLGLAQWLTHEDHPLTARIAVNRLWQQLFGVGIVSTSDDFGNQGALPTHPALLDWLAIDFQENDWDVKRLMRMLVTSNTYQQSSRVTPQLLEVDPDNEWLARSPRYRRSAEMIRDNLLASSGLLVPTVGGRSTFPYQPAGLWGDITKKPFFEPYAVDIENGIHRRSLYSFWKRNLPPPSMLIFDAATRSECQMRRQQSNTPLQALVLLNDPQVLEACRVFAERVWHRNDKIDEALNTAFTSLIGRRPSSKEEEILSAYYQAEFDQFTARPSEADSFLQVGAVALDPDLPIPKVAALARVANTIMNSTEGHYKN